MAGLLNTLKKNWRGLLDEVQAAPESLRALTQPAAAQQFDAALRKGGTIDKEKAVKMAMDVLQTTPMGVMGKIVYHGSPHKFDKFDISKIGTGEGAQAYGHGLYFAESPTVAMDYAAKLSTQGKSGPWWEDMVRQHIARGNDIAQAKAKVIKTNPQLAEKINAIPDDLLDVSKYHYKVDIPDEAVSRMLDWDKPLSQQAPEVRNSIINASKNSPDAWIRGWAKTWDEYPISTGQEIYRSIANRLGNQNVPAFRSSVNVPEASEMLKQAGIPGIRYLDGGSRTAGGGTSNFVLFDDQLPRILERNGIPTGLNPWSPGEWRGLLEP